MRKKKNVLGKEELDEEKSGRSQQNISISGKNGKEKEKKENLYLCIHRVIVQGRYREYKHCTSYSTCILCYERMQGKILVEFENIGKKTNKNTFKA